MEQVRSVCPRTVAGGWRRALSPSGAITIAVGLLLLSRPAAAYLGPGSGLSAIGAVLAVFGAVAFAIVGLIWYPFKRLIQYLRSRGKVSRE